MDLTKFKELTRELMSYKNSGMGLDPYYGGPNLHPYGGQRQSLFSINLYSNGGYLEVDVRAKGGMSTSIPIRIRDARDAKDDYGLLATTFAEILRYMAEENVKRNVAKTPIPKKGDSKERVMNQALGYVVDVLEEVQAGTEVDYEQVENNIKDYLKEINDTSSR